MRYTLLEMVQRILSSMDSDEVNSINDTTESYQVALLIEGVYNDLLAESNLPETGTMFELTQSTDTTKPVLMTVPDDITSLEWVQYNIQADADDYPDFKDIVFKPLKDFLAITYGYSSVADTTIADSFDHSITNNSVTDTITFVYKMNIEPTYYTSFDDGTLIFDSYDNTVDLVQLVKAKTQCWGSISPTFTLTDGFVPRLNQSQSSLLMNEAKARAFVELKQASNTNAEGHARRLRVRLRNSKKKMPNQALHPLPNLPNYGRK
jgi:hypothetical protein